MVLEKENPVYILQRINHNVFSDIDGIMANINNDRCLSLFDFTQKALNELDYMQKVVSGKLN